MLSQNYDDLLSVNPFFTLSIKNSSTYLGTLKETQETGGSSGVTSMLLGWFGLVILSWSALQSYMCLHENH